MSRCRRRWRRRHESAEIRLHFRFRRHLLTYVHVSMLGSSVFSQPPSCRQLYSDRKCVRQLQALTSFRYGFCWSLQTFIFPIEFVDQNQLSVWRLALWQKRMSQNPSIGVSKTLKNPPFYKMCRFFCNAVFFADKALKSFRLRWSLVF